MMKTINKIWSLLLIAALMPVAASAQSQTKLTAEDFTVQAGTTSVLAVNLVNPDMVVTTFQFDVTLPDGLEIPYDADEEGYKAVLTDRVQGLFLDSYAVNEKTIRFAVFPVDGKSISGTSGTLINITVKAASTSFTNGVITIDHIIIGQASGAGVKPAAVEVNVTNGSSSQDPTSDPQNVGIQFDYPSNIFGITAGSTENLPINIDNGAFKVTCIKFKVSLPKGLSITGITRGDRLNASHDVSCTPVEEGYYNVLIWSPTNKTIKNASGVVCTLIIKAANDVQAGAVKVYDIELTSPDAIMATPDDFQIAVEASSGIEAISGEKLQNVNVYNLQGVKVLENASSLEGLSKGIYVVNGKKVVKN